MTHGTTHAYKVLHCRCDLCRAANAVAHERWRRRKGVLPRWIWEETAKAKGVHGTASRYNKGCRCEVCKKAAALRRRAIRRRQGMRPVPALQKYREDTA